MWQPLTTPSLKILAQLADAFAFPAATAPKYRAGGPYVVKWRNKKIVNTFGRNWVFMCHIVNFTSACLTLRSGGGASTPALIFRDVDLWTELIGCCTAKAALEPASKQTRRFLKCMVNKRLENAAERPNAISLYSITAQKQLSMVTYIEESE
jgi:hypothetical protein